MKKNHYYLTLALCSLLTLTAVAENNVPGDGTDDPKKTEKQLGQSCIVFKKDGTSQHFTSLKLVTGVFTSPHLLADGKIKILPEEIIAYQANDIYAVSQQLLSDKRLSKVATEVLPGFATRIVAGSLNIYTRKVFNGAKAVDQLYVQCGENGLIEPFRYDLLKQIINDNPNISGMLKSKNKKQIDSRKIQAVAEAYNNTQSMTKN